MDAFFDQVVEKSATLSVDRGLHLYSGRGKGFRFIPYHSFLAVAQQLGDQWYPVRPVRREVVLIGYRHPGPALLAFFAALSAGTIPLILPSPKVAGGSADFLSGLKAWIGRFRGRCRVAAEEGLLPDSDRFEGVALGTIPTEPEFPDTHVRTAQGGDARRPEEIAFLQCTSATTGEGKLVAISNANILCNLKAIRSAVSAGENESVVSWLPLYHDMGLVGTTLFSFYHGYSLYLMGPFDFLKQPLFWIKAISDFRCTLTAAPNFGFDFAERNIRSRDLEGLNLSSIKGAFLGAEPIRHETVSRFVTKFAPYGFSSSSILPCYGLAEATLAAAVDSPFSPPRYVDVEPKRLEMGKPVSVLSKGSVAFGTPGRNTLEGTAVFCEGRTVEGLELDIVGEDGLPIPESGRLGEIRLRGNSISGGYLNPETMEVEAFAGGQIKTGDLGFILENELFVLERKKNIIIRNGQNFPCAFLEERVAEILGLSPHEVMVLETDLHLDTKVIAVVENHSGTTDIPESEIVRFSELDVHISEIRYFQKRVIPRTTSGKKKYFLARQKFAIAGSLESISIYLMKGAEEKKGAKEK